MASTLVRELIDAGIHFGHRASRWNPKMRPFIFDTKNLIHIIDIRETMKGILRAKKFIARTVASGGDILFVGCKRQARESIKTHSERCGMHYVVERWLGGTLTNFRTIRSRLQRLEELEALVGSPTWETAYSKKMQSTLQRELKKVRRNLEGIRRMTRLPAAMVIIDVSKEVNAVREAQSLGIPTVCLLDTDGDPDRASIAIPGNDDSIRAIELVVRHLSDAVEEGKKARPEPSEDTRRRDAGGPGPVRRGRRFPSPRGEGGPDSGESDPTTAVLDAAAAVPMLGAETAMTDAAAQPPQA